ncbi:MAG TPA: ATP-binding protein [Thermoanaerobaculia bacterium]|nr:ATP-binding protein [Thermoanaerobaculia bacterium]
MNDSASLPRALQVPLERAARAMPVVVVTGARQTGKSTLVRDLTSTGDRLYLTLDDLDVLEQARHAPEDLVSRASRMTLDEVQRAPELMLAIKRAVDRQRRKGQYLLTGSANLLLLKSISETLAGRASYLTLWPMTRREQLGLGRSGIWEELVAADDAGWLDLVSSQEVPREKWVPLALRGGYPTPALELESAGERATWFSGYTKTYLERDLQDISAVTALPDLRRLMRAACLRLGQLVNQTELGRDVALPQPTVHRYMNLLEMSYQLVRLPAYSVNRTSRLIKTPKIYWCDTGLALHLSGMETPSGAHLENLVLIDLLSWREGRNQATEILYWRTASGAEVDLVIETGGKLIPIEVKSTARPGHRDAQHLRSFREEYGKLSRPGLLLHTGDRIEWLAPGILAAPWWRVI